MGAVSLVCVEVSHPYTGRLVHSYLRSCRSSNSWQTVDSAAQKFPLLLLNSVVKVISRGSPVNLCFSLEPLRIFLEGWHCEAATAGSGCHCSLWCWVPGCLLQWLCPGTGYCSHATGLISWRQNKKKLVLQKSSGIN